MPILTPLFDLESHTLLPTSALWRSPPSHLPLVPASTISLLLLKKKIFILKVLHVPLSSLIDLSQPVLPSTPGLHSPIVCVHVFICIQVHWLIYSHPPLSAVFPLGLFDASTRSIFVHWFVLFLRFHIGLAPKAGAAFLCSR